MRLLTGFALLTVLALPKSANAATVVFDICDVPAHCKLMQMNAAFSGDKVGVPPTTSGTSRYFGSQSLQAVPVPEPSTMILLGTGLLLAASARKRLTAKK